MIKILNEQTGIEISLDNADYTRVIECVLNQLDTYKDMPKVCLPEDRGLYEIIDIAHRRLCGIVTRLTAVSLDEDDLDDDNSQND